LRASSIFSADEDEREGGPASDTMGKEVMSDNSGELERNGSRASQLLGIGIVLVLVLLVIWKFLTTGL
jgi:hypothetical protein